MNNPFCLLPLASCLILISCTSEKIAPTTKPTVSVFFPPSPSAADVTEAAKLRQIGIGYRNSQRYSEAIAALEKSTQIDPYHLSGKVILGWTYHLAKQENDAAKTLLDTLKLDANHVPALNALGIVYLVDGQLAKAVETHTKAIQLKPDNEIAHYNLSLAYHRLEQFERAITHAQTATTLEPHNPHPWVALAIAYWDKGDKVNAQKSYQQALNLDSQYRERGYLEHLQQAGFSREQIQVTDKVRQDIF